MSNEIKILDKLTVNKIAAGEIIERPSSVIKELVENSIDANSKNIIIDVKNGGKSFIRISDDGEGISEDNIDIAFLRYSTSKIRMVEDLEKIYSLGFRGEALASIAAAAKVETLTKTKNQTRGIRISLENGKIIFKEHIGCPNGTTMIIRDLFYNIPARKKFLKSNVTESNYINDVIYKLALGHPNISFKYIRDDRVILKTPGNNDIVSNIYSILGKEFVNSLIKIHFKNELLNIDGFISNNNFYRASRKHQYIFVNGRYVKNDDISKNIEKCYKSLIPINKFPIFILFLNVNAKKIDVNIHPTKLQIKFENTDEICDTIYDVVNYNLKKSLFVPKIKIDNTQPKTNNKQLYLDDLNQQNHKKSIQKNIFTSCDKLKVNNNKIKNNTLQKENIIKESEKICQDFLKEKNDIVKDKVTINDFLDNINVIGVLFSTYILAQDLKKQNFYIIDQHAAHERIMYEKYKNEYENENIIIQKLISPEIIDLTSSEISLVKNNFKFLNKLGFEIDEFGFNSIALRGVPLLFGKPNSKQLFLDVLDNLKNNISNAYDIRKEKIMKLACCSAIKGGDKISDIEINKLLNDLKKVKNPYTCPHGRPTIITVDKREIEKKFKRIQ